MSLRQWVFLPIISVCPSPTRPVRIPAHSFGRTGTKLTLAKLEAARQTFEGYWKDKYCREVEIPYQVPGAGWRPVPPVVRYKRTRLRP